MPYQKKYHKNPNNPKTPNEITSPNITIIIYSRDNDTGDKITVIPSCKHKLNAHKPNKPRESLWQAQITLMSQIIITPLNTK